MTEEQYLNSQIEKYRKRKADLDAIVDTPYRYVSRLDRWSNARNLRLFTEAKKRLDTRNSAISEANRKRSLEYGPENESISVPQANVDVSRRKSTS